MSKLYAKYEELKKDNDKKIYIFLCGNFYICLDSDAIILNELFDLKLTRFSNLCDKCGFPKTSLEKYINLFKEKNIDYKIIIEIDEKTKIDKIKELLDCDIDNLGKKELKNIIEEVKKLI